MTKPTKTFDCPEWPNCKLIGKCTDGVVSHDCPLLKQRRDEEAKEGGEK